ncbi:MAG TPA: sulfotransferase [Rhizomicrobium sp.]|nr:sulfotransferase [Rhizomicrobium sp.]
MIDEPKSPDLNAKLSAILRTARGPGAGAALVELRRLARAPEATAQIFDALAQLCQEQNQVDEALAASEEAVARDPKLVGAWYRLGIIHAQRQNGEAARDALERVVSLNPGFAAAHSNLGFVLQNLLGLNDDAAEHYRQAIGVNPAYAEAHRNLASLLAMSGRYDEALALVRRAVELKPGDARTYMIAALAETDRERFDAALAWIARLPPDAKHDPQVLSTVGEILFKAKRYEEALAACRDAIRLAPDHGEAFLCRGSVLLALGRHIEALAAFDRAMALMPASAEAVAGKASALLELARPTEAMKLFDRARALEPTSAIVLYLRALASEFRLPNAEIAELEALLADKNTTSAVDRAQLSFVLANAYLRAGDTLKGFAHLHEGNRIKRSLIDYDPTEAERVIPLVETVFSPSTIETAAGDTSAAPIFIVGMPRSGTTLIEQILASHPDVHGAGEVLAMLTLVRDFERKRRTAFPSFVADLKPDDQRALGAEYLARIGTLPEGKTRFVDKMPSNAIFAGLIHLMLPNARIILCRRNPFDTCLSCYSILFSGQQNFTYDLTELGRYYRTHETLMAHWRKVMPQDRFLEIEYEDVVEDIERKARELVAFCGLEWSDQCLRFHESKRPVRTASMLQVRKPLYASSVGRWRQYRGELGPLFESLGLPVPE